MQQVKLYDLGHFEHLRLDVNFYEVGKTVYNCDVKRKPIIKQGKAPHELLDIFHLWFTMEQAERDLRELGFVKRNQVLWIKGE